VDGLLAIFSRLTLTILPAVAVLIDRELLEALP
jgi:hypothetical protein